MIAYISGKIIDISALQITLVLESGVGYEIGINERIFSQLAGNTTTDLYIHHHITENNQSLFGFIEKSEKQVFRELLKIS